MCSACVTLCECEKISEQGGKGGGGGQKEVHCTFYPARLYQKVSQH